MTDDPTVDTDPADVDHDADEWHGIQVVSAIGPDGSVMVTTTQCPELTPLQLATLLDRTLDSLIDTRRDLVWGN